MIRRVRAYSLKKGWFIMDGYRMRKITNIWKLNPHQRCEIELDSDDEISVGHEEYCLIDNDCSEIPEERPAQKKTEPSSWERAFAEWDSIARYIIAEAYPEEYPTTTLHDTWEIGDWARLDMDMNSPIG